MVSVSTALGLLREGAKLRQVIEGEEVGVDFNLRQPLISTTEFGEKAVLALVVLTNQSDRPRSVTDIVLDFGTSRAARMPLNGILDYSAGGYTLKAQSFTGPVFFKNETLSLRDWRILPADIYLRPRESVSGCALFLLDNIDDVSKLLVIIEVGGAERIAREVAI